MFDLSWNVDSACRVCWIDLKRNQAATRTSKETWSDNEMGKMWNREKTKTEKCETRKHQWMLFTNVVVSCRVGWWKKRMWRVDCAVVAIDSCVWVCDGGMKRRGEARGGESNESIRFVSLSQPPHTVNPLYSRMWTCNATHALINLFYRTQVILNMECDSTAIYHHQ